MSRSDITLREVLLADMYEAEKDLLQKEIDRLTAELERYKQGVWVGGVVEPLHPTRLFECGYIKLPQEMIGRRVRVLVIKEDGDEHI